MDIHIVDDDENIQEIFTEFAENMGFTALSFYSAERYLYHVCYGNYTVPKLVVLTDLEMPGMYGDELIGEIRKKTPNQRFILATGHPEKVIRMKENACFYLTKPVRMKHL